MCEVRPRYWTPTVFLSCSIDAVVLPISRNWHYVELRKEKLDDKMRASHECVVALRSFWSMSTTNLRLCHLSSRRTNVIRHKGCRSVLHTNKSLVSFARRRVFSSVRYILVYFILLLHINMGSCIYDWKINVESALLKTSIPLSIFAIARAAPWNIYSVNSLFKWLLELDVSCDMWGLLFFPSTGCFYVLPTHAVHEVLLCTLLVSMPSDHSATLLDFVAFAHAMRSCCACCSLIVCCFSVQGVHLMIQSVSPLCIIKDCVWKCAVATDPPSCATTCSCGISLADVHTTDSTGHCRARTWTDAGQLRVVSFHTCGRRAGLRQSHVSLWWLPESSWRCFFGGCFNAAVVWTECRRRVPFFWVNVGRHDVGHQESGMRVLRLVGSIRCIDTSPSAASHRGPSRSLAHHTPSTGHKCRQRSDCQVGWRGLRNMEASCLPRFAVLATRGVAFIVHLHDHHV